MKYKMRELRGDDLFILLSIVSKLDIKDDLIGLFEGTTQAISKEKLEQLTKKHKGDKEKLQAALQLEIQKTIDKRGVRIVGNLIVKIMGSLELIKDDLNKLLSDLCEDLSLTQVKELGLTDYTTLVMDFFKKPELQDFLKLMKPLLLSESTENPNAMESTS